MSNPTAPQEYPVSLVAGLLSYLVPGLGQIYQGRIGKGLLFMVCLLGLFHLGHAMGGWKNVYIPVGEDFQFNDEHDRGMNDPIDGKQADDEQFRERLSSLRRQRLRQLPDNLYQRWHFLGQFWIGVSAWPSLWQYFALPMPTKAAHPFWHDLQRCPSEAEINAFWVDTDKTPDLGWIYTVIAGVLNILVIYDAYAGPAFHGDPREQKKEPKPQEASA